MYFIIIPAGFTGLLQPLDIAINRSLQQWFNDKYVAYLEEGIDDPRFQTTKNNIKISSPHSMYVDLCLAMHSSLKIFMKFYVCIMKVKLTMMNDC